MKKKIAVNILLVIMLFAAPYIALADHATVKSDVLDPNSDLFALKGPLVICLGAGGTASLPNCNSLTDLIAQIANVIYFTIAVVIWIITPVLVTVGGLMIMFAGASPGLIETGKKTITGAVIGIVIVLAAYLIVATFVGFLGIQGIGGFGASPSSGACSGSNPNGSCPSGQSCQLISGPNTGGGTSLYGCQ